MTSASAILNELPPLKGELPASSTGDITLLVCLAADQATPETLTAIAAVKVLTGAARIHVHSVGADSVLRARITLWAAANAPADFSATFEDVGETQSAPDSAGLIRLFQIAGLARGAYAFCPLSELDRLPEGIFSTVSPKPLSAPHSSDRLTFVCDKSDTALAILAKVVEPLVKRMRAGILQQGDALKTKDAVITALRSQSDEAVGTLEISFDPIGTKAPAEPRRSIWPDGDGLKVLLFKPDLSLPFKSPELVADRVRRKEGSPFLTGSHGALRESWAACFDTLAKALEVRGHRVVCLERPGTEITPELADEAGADLVILPHRQRFQCPVQTPALYLMQIAHRWLFTLDEDGWGAGAKAYPYAGFDNSPVDSGIFERYRDALFGANDSKFSQPDRRSFDTLVTDGTLPDAPYLFFPCQIPDDEVVRFFCDVSEHEVVTALTKWATAREVHIVFKAHPAAPKTSDAFRKIANTPFTHWADASIHDLIENCIAVITLNSGVGHEAILHGKPIIMFGRSEYDTLAIKTSPQELDDAYGHLQTWDAASQLKKYYQFYHWFTRDMALDLSDETAKADALERVIDRIERLV